VHKEWKRRAILLLAALALPATVGLAGPAGARAEAPFFYDAIGDLAVVDTTFQPARRTAGGLALFLQAWSVPGTPAQSPGRQEVAGEYRLQWSYPLDPRYELRLELKADTRDGAIDEDYFLRGEFFYKGAHVPLWFYGGVRLPEKDNVGGYAGLETMSRRLGDVLPLEPPLAVRAFAEARLSQDEPHPTVRFMGLLHTVPARQGSFLVAGAALDTYFQEMSAPRWILQGHLELEGGRKLLRFEVTAGYAVEPATGEQRVSLGVRRGVF
jgi:hypothetical protein